MPGIDTWGKSLAFWAGSAVFILAVVEVLISTTKKSKAKKAARLGHGSYDEDIDETF